MKYTTASEAAKYFIASLRKQGNEISNLKLQKLLYYAQGWHLALHGPALFQEPIQAWVHGPVVPSVFRTYKEYGWKPITLKLAPPQLSDFSFHLQEVLRVYGDLDAVMLERMTHREKPWLETRGTLSPDEPSTREITTESMKTYFSARIHG